MRGKVDWQEVDEYKTEVKYSYYWILMLDTVQPIVNSNKAMESYGKRQKVVEGTTSFYIILVWTRICVILEKYGLL